MDIEALAKKAGRIFNRIPWHIAEDHGLEFQRGFFVIYNHVTGQSRTTLYHPQSDLIFKNCGWPGDPSNSGKHIGTVTLDGVTYNMRYPRMHFFDAPNGYVEVQEYVHGKNDPCLDGHDTYTDAWCEHAYAVHTASGLSDTHTGNWKIVGNEVVIFDG